MLTSKNSSSEFYCLPDPCLLLTLRCISMCWSCFICCCCFRSSIRKDVRRSLRIRHVFHRKTSSRNIGLLWKKDLAFYRLCSRSPSIEDVGNVYMGVEKALSAGDAVMASSGEHELCAGQQKVILSLRRLTRMLAFVRRDTSLCVAEGWHFMCTMYSWCDSGPIYELL